MARFNVPGWLRSLTKSKNKTYEKKPRVRLAVETLEDRVAPATFQWDGGGTDNKWSTAANWVGDVAPNPGAGDDLLFPIGVSKLTTNNDFDNAIFNSISFAGSNYLLNGKTITLGTAVANTGYVIANLGSVNNTINFDIAMGGAAGNRQFFTVGTAGASLTINGLLTGTSGVELSKDGAGTLILAGNNSGFTGAVSITQGAINIRHVYALGDTTGVTTILNTGQLQVENVTGDIAEKLTLNGPGLVNDGALLNVGGDNTWTGNIELDSDSTIGATTGTLTIYGVVSDLGGGHNLTKEGAGKVVLAPLNTYAGNTYRGRTYVNAGMLAISHPFSLGVGGTTANNTVVKSGPAASGTLALQYINDPRILIASPYVYTNIFNNRIGFKVPDELLTLNGPGLEGIYVAPRSMSTRTVATNPINTTTGALSNQAGNNSWERTINFWSDDSSVLGGPWFYEPVVTIGAEANTNLTINGVIQDPGIFSNYSFSKVGPGRVILTNANTYTADIDILEGYLNIRDSGALGLGASLGKEAWWGTTLELEADGIIDSVTGTYNLELPGLNYIWLNGPGANYGTPQTGDSGALRNISGTNVLQGDVSLQSSATIRVEPDPDPNNVNGNPWDDLSQLTINGQIDGGGRNLTKAGLGELVLTTANTYSGLTYINQGWVTIQHNQALGSQFATLPDTRQPGTYVAVGAALHLKQSLLGADLTVAENITLSGNGFNHRYAWLNQQGALTNLAGNNLLTGIITLVATAPATSKIGIGAEIDGADPAVTFSELTINNRIQEALSNPANVNIGITTPASLIPAGINKVGRKRVIIQSPGIFTGANQVSAGILRIQSDTALGMVDGTTTVLSGAALELKGYVAGLNGGVPGGIQVREHLILNGAGNVTADDPTHDFTSPVLVNTVTNLSDDNLWNGRVTLQANVGVSDPVIDTKDDSRLSLWKDIDGSGGFIKVGNGKLVIGGNNSYNGVTYINQGIVNLQGPTALGTTAGGTIVANEAQIELQGDITIGGEPLTIQGNGPNSVPNLPLRWFGQGPGPINNGQTIGNEDVTGRVTGVAVDPNDTNVLYLSAAGGGAWRSKDGGYTWQPLIDSVPGAPTQTLYTGAIAVGRSNSRIIYVGTGEANNSGDSFYGRGVLKSSDYGKTWTQLNGPSGELDRKTISKIVVDPVDDNIIYIAVSNNGVNGLTGNTGIWRYNGNLGTWTNLTATGSGIPASAIFDDWSDVVVLLNTRVSTLSPSSRFIAAAIGTTNGTASNAAYISLDSGATWQLYSFPVTEDLTYQGVTVTVPRNGVIKLAASPNSSSSSFTIYAAVTYPSNYASFFDTFPPFNQPTPFQPLRNNFRYVQKTTITWNTTNGVWDVANWATTGATPGNYQGTQGFYNSVIAVNPTNANYIFLAGVNQPFTVGPYVSTDGGATWTDIGVGPSPQPHVDYHALTWDSSNRLLVGNDGGIWRLANGTPGSISWTNLNGNFQQITQFNGLDVHPYDPFFAVGGSQDNGTEIYDDNIIWEHVEDGDGGIVRINNKNPQIMFHVLNGTLRRSTTGGAQGSWSTVFSVGGLYFPFILDRVNPSRVLLGSGSVVYESMTDGASGSFINIGSQNGIIRQLAVADRQGTFAADGSFSLVVDKGANAYDSDTVYALTSTGVQVTKNHGAWWVTRNSGLTTSNLRDLAVDPRNRDTAYVVRSGFGGGKVYKTTNAGQTWTNITGNLPDLPVWKVVVNNRNGDVYIGSDNGVWYLPGGLGTTWQRLGVGMPEVQIRELVFNPLTNMLSAGTYGRGMFQLWLDDSQANSGALRAITGSSVWNGNVTLTGATDIRSDINAQLNIIGSIQDSPEQQTLTLTGIVGPAGAFNLTYNGQTTGWLDFKAEQQQVTVNGQPGPLGSFTLTFNGQTTAPLAFNAEQQKVSVSGSSGTFTLTFDAQTTSALAYNATAAQVDAALEALANIGAGGVTVTKAGNDFLVVFNGSSLVGINQNEMTALGIGGTTAAVSTEVDGARASATDVQNALNALSSIGGVGGSVAVTAAGNDYIVTFGGSLTGADLPQITAAGTDSAATTVTTLTNGAQATAAQVEAALNALSTIGGVGGSVSVSQNSNVYTVTFGGKLVGYDLPAITTSVADGVVATVTTVAEGAPQITKVGPGRLIFSGPNTYAGMTFVQEGVLASRHARALGANNSEQQKVTINSGSGDFTLTFNGQTTGVLAFDATAAQVEAALNALSTISGVGGTVHVLLSGGVYTITFGGTLNGFDLPDLIATDLGAMPVVTTVKDGHGAEQQIINVSGASGTFTLTFNGYTTAALAYNITAAALATALNNLASIGGSGMGGYVTVTQNGGQYIVTFGGTLSGFDLPLMTTNGGIGGATSSVSAFREGVGGTIIDSLANPNTALEIQADLELESILLKGGGVNVNGHDTGALRSVSNNNTFTGTILLDGDATIGIDSGSQLTIGTKIGAPALAGIGTITDGSNTYRLTKELTGTLVLNSANTYDGLTDIVQGALRVEHNNALGGTANGTQVHDGAQIQISKDIFGVGVTVTGERLDLSGTGIFGTGAILNHDGNNTWQGPIRLMSIPAIPSPPPPTPPTDISFGVRQVGDALTINGIISENSGSFGLNKVGAGKLIFKQNNSYTGNTSVQVGRLNIQSAGALGSIAGTAQGTTTVVSGAALELENNVTFDAEPLILNGKGTSEVQTITVTGGAGTFTLTFDGQSTLALANDATAADVENALNGLSNIGWVGGSVSVTLVNGVYTVVFGGTLAATDVSLITATTTGLTNVAIAALLEGAQGALRNVAGTNTYTGTVTLNTTVASASSTANPSIFLGVDNGTQLTISGTVQDPAGVPATYKPAELHKISAGTLVLSNANTYVGSTLVDAGMVNIRHDTALGACNGAEQQTVSVTGSSGSFSLSFKGLSTGLLAYNASAGQVQAALNVLQSIGGFGGTVNVAKAGNVYTITFGGNYLGYDLPQLTGGGIGGASVAINTVSNGYGATTVANGATLQVQGGITQTTESLTIQGSGVTGQGALVNTGNTNNWNASIILAGNSVIGSTSGQLTINGQITDGTNTFGVTKVGGATLEYASTTDNTYNGLTLVNDGILVLNKTGGAIPFNGNLTVGDTVNAADSAIARLLQANQILDTATVTVNIDGFLDLNGQNETVGPLVIQNGHVRTGDGNALTINTSLNMTGGDIELGTAGNQLIFGSAATITATSSGTEIAEIHGSGGALSLTGANPRTFNVGNGALPTDLLVSTPITGAGGERLIKAGAGLMEIDSNANTYTGVTEVKAGTLQVDGTIGAVELSGGTLSGVGTTGTVTTIAGGGATAPGSSPGILHSGSVTWDANTTFNVELNRLNASPAPLVPGTDYDQLQITGDLDLGGAHLAGLVDALGVGVLLNDSFTIITFTGSRLNNSKFAEGDSIFVDGKKFSITYGPNSVVLNKVKANVLLSTTANANPSRWGQDVTFTTTVTPETGAGAVPGTATLTFVLDSNPVYTVIKNVVGNQASMNPFSEFGSLLLSVGTHTVDVTFLDSSNLFDTNADSFTQTVNKSNTSIALASGSNPSVSGEPVVITATITPTAPGGQLTGSNVFETTGTVTFTVDSVAQAPVFVTAGGTASITLNGLLVGAHNISAVYSGDTHFNGSSSSTLVQQVNKANSTVAINPNPSPSGVGQNVNFTVTVAAAAPGTGTPTGTVTLLDGSTVIGSGTLSGGQRTFSISTLAFGSHTITAQYSGSTNFNASNNNVTHYVKNGTTTTVVSSLNPSNHGASVDFTATVTVIGGGTATGTVTFDINGSTFDVALTGNQAVYTTSSLVIGTHTVSATYNGDTNYTPSTSTSFTQTVKGNTTTALATTNPNTVFGNATITATVAAVAPAVGTPTGTVTFYINNGTTTTSQTKNLVGGVATLDPLGVGTYTITATYNGDSDFAISNANSLNQVFTKGNTTTALATTNNNTVYGGTIITATVAAVVPAVGTPTGSVIFYINNGTTITPQNVSLVGGVATLPNLDIGTYTITATYGGDGNFFSSNQLASINQTINPVGSTTTLASTANPAMYGQQVTITATVAPNAPSTAIPTGTLTFFINSVAQTPVNLVNGAATLSFNNWAVGTYTISATYSGNTNIGGSSSSNLPQAVIQALTTTTLTSAPSPSYISQLVTFTATVAPIAPGGGTPTGTVNFVIDGGAPIPVALVNGTATLQTSSLSVGNHNVTATYVSNNTGYAGSNNAIIHKVGANPLNFITVPTTVVSGGAFTVKVEYRDANGVRLTTFTGPVTLALNSGPAGGRISGTLTVNAVAGVATFTNVILDRAGNYTLRATTPGIPQHVVTPLTIKVVANQILATLLTANVAALSPFRMQVRAADVTGNTATNYTGQVRVTIYRGPTGGTLGGTTVLNMVGGVANFNNLIFNKNGTYILKITSGSLVKYVTVVSRGRRM